MFSLVFIVISAIVPPPVMPTLIVMGHDPIWQGILIAINPQTSFLAPPFGLSLFYLRGAAPPEVITDHINKGVAPFIGLQAVGMFLVCVFPFLATRLPGSIF